MRKYAKLIDVQIKKHFSCFFEKTKDLLRFLKGKIRRQMAFFYKKLSFKH